VTACPSEASSEATGRMSSRTCGLLPTAGDNERADCPWTKPRAYEPLERLAKPRQMFFGGDASLGQRRMKLMRQARAADTRPIARTLAGHTPT